jgi:hypothetical protein
LQGPDYYLTNFDSQDDEKMRTLLRTVLSLGNGGEILLKVMRNGFLAHESGSDLSIFQTSWHIGNYYWQKFARVGISDNPAPETFRWLPCDPFKGILAGCAGAVPTKEGGDRFDLASFGLRRGSYIWIKDIGKNKNMTSKWPTEGISLDALRFEHAYTNK